MTLKEAFARVQYEIVHGKLKHDPLASAHDGLGRLLGEVDELQDEVWHNRGPERSVRICSEALQVAAVAIRLAIEEWDHA